METIAKRVGRPTLSRTGEQVLDQYEQRLCTEEDLTVVTVRNYLSDLRHFAAWCESIWKQGQEEEPSFTPGAVTTPTLTDHRTYLQQVLHLKPNSVNRSLISLKRYFAWLLKHQSSTTPLFLSEKRHAQLTERGSGYVIKKYAERARVSDVSPHDLRHRFGYRMAEVVPLHRLAQIMGHDSLDTTMLYIRGTQQDLQREVEKIAWR
jgi:site-specific recombinase XerD